MINNQHTIYGYSLRLVCIIMLLLVQFDVLGCVVSNYNRTVINITEYAEGKENESESQNVEETFYRYGNRIITATPQILYILIPTLVVSSPNVTLYIPVNIKFHSLQTHAIYCVYLI